MQVDLRQIAIRIIRFREGHKTVLEIDVKTANIIPWNVYPKIAIILQHNKRDIVNPVLPPAITTTVVTINIPEIATKPIT